MRNRFLSVFLPQWSIELTLLRERKQRRSPDSAPVLLITKIQNQIVVQNFCARAKALGVRRGMSLTLAQALAPGALHAEINPRYDITALYRLALWAATNLSPLVGLDEEIVLAWGKKEFSTLLPLNFGITVNLTGTERIHGSDEAIFKKVADFLAPHQLTAQLAIAPTIGAAWGLSRFNSSPTAITTTPLAQALAPLPIAALRVEPPTVQALGELGIYSIGMLGTLPKRTLLSRFGLKLLKRLDQIHGAAEEQLPALNFPPTHFIERSFDSPLQNRKAIELVLNQLVQTLNTKLFERGRKAQRFLFRLSGRTPAGHPLTTVHELSLQYSSSRPRHLTQVLATFAEGIEFPGMVEEIRISAASSERIRTTQGEFVAGAVSENFSQEIGELLNSLALRLGANQITQATLNSAHLPEEGFVHKPAKFVTATNLAPIEEPAHRERPSYILPVPEEIVVIALLPDHPPSWLRWRGVDLRVAHGSGPERLCGRWWQKRVEALGPQTTNSPIEQRDYFRIQDENGRWLWVFRDRRSRWFLHGLWI